MGNEERAKSSKSNKSTSLAPQTQNGMHTYPPPHWAAMQAFYGPRIPFPQYYSTGYPVGHPPHHPYIWGPRQAMMSSFAAPYAAIYSQGGVCARPGVPVVSPKPGSAALSMPFASEALAATALCIQTPGKTSGHTTGTGADSESSDTGGSSSGCREKTSGDEQSHRKRKLDGSSDLGKTLKLEIQANAITALDTDTAPSMVPGLALDTDTAPSMVPGLALDTDTAPSMVPGLATVPAVNGKLESVATLEMKTNHAVNSKMSFDAQLSGSKLSSETGFQSERQLKQERRKQSNRESARRSRLRKQAETEELAAKVDVLMAENVTLKAEINQLVTNLEKLKLENSRMMEKLKNAKLVKADKMESEVVDNSRNQPLSTENLLSRVNNSGSIVTQEEDEDKMYTNNKSKPTKLRQLLDASPRTDAVAAS